MSFMKKAFWMFAIALILVSALTFAVDEPKQTRVIILPVYDGSTLVSDTIDISVLAFNPGIQTPIASQTGRGAEGIAQACNGQNDCIIQRSVAGTSQLTGGRINADQVESVQNAHFEYYRYDQASGRFVLLTTPGEGCLDAATRTSSSGSLPSSTGNDIPFTYYYVRCKLAPDVFSSAQRTQLRIDFVPTSTQNYVHSTEYYTIQNPNPIDPMAAIRTQIAQILSGQGAGGNLNTGFNTVPCIAIFLLGSLLLAGMYFSGKSPLSLLDITTPRLPAPKGVAAGGQIMLPWGYAEFKAVTKKQLGATAGLIGSITSRIEREGRNSDSEYRRLSGNINNLAVNEVDRIAGDSGTNKQIARGLVALGRELGFSGDRLAELTTALPRNYNDAQHRLVREILNAANARGGRFKLAHDAFNMHFTADKNLDTLLKLTGHDEGRSRYFYLTNLMGKMLGPAKYAIALNSIPSTVDSGVRSGRIVQRGVVGFAKAIPEFGRDIVSGVKEIGKTQSEIRAIRRNQPRQRSKAGTPGAEHFGDASNTAAIMGRVFRTQRTEAYRDATSYVIAQILKTQGLDLNVTHEQIRDMGWRLIDTTKGFNGSARLASIESEMIEILRRNTSERDKFDALRNMARRYAARIDENASTMLHRLDEIQSGRGTDYDKYMLAQHVFDDQHGKIREAVSQSARQADAYVCNVGGAMDHDRIWMASVGGRFQRAVAEGTLHPTAHDGEHFLMLIDQETIRWRNSTTTLTPTAQVDGLPAWMRNVADLRMVEEDTRNRMIRSVFTLDAEAAFEQARGKSLRSASLSELVEFLQKGANPVAGLDQYESRLPGNFTHAGFRTLVEAPDKRTDVASWTQMVFSEGAATIWSPTVEAELNRRLGANRSGVSIEAQSQMAREIMMDEKIVHVAEANMSAAFKAYNAYGDRGTTKLNRNVMGICAGYMAAVLEEKGLSEMDPDRAFVESMNINNPAHIERLRALIEKHRTDFESIQTRQLTFDDVKRSDRVYVMLQEGGIVPWHKAMLISDFDRILNGVPAIWKNGYPVEFKVDEVHVKFDGADHLYQGYADVRNSKNYDQWVPFIQSVKNWARAGTYDAAKEEIFAKIVWECGVATARYEDFWDQTALTMVPRKDKVSGFWAAANAVGVQSETADRYMSGVERIVHNMGETFTGVIMHAGGNVARESNNIAFTWETQRQEYLSFQQNMQSGGYTIGTNSYNRMGVAEEKAAYAAMKPFLGVMSIGLWAIDRAPGKLSTDPGMGNVYTNKFHEGPGYNRDPKEMYAGYFDSMSEFSFNTFYGFSMGLTRRLSDFWTPAFRKAQQSFHDTAMRPDINPDPMKHMEGRGTMNQLAGLRSVFSMGTYWEPESTVGKWIHSILVWDRDEGRYRSFRGEHDSLLDNPLRLHEASMARRANANPGSGSIDQELNYTLAGPGRVLNSDPFHKNLESVSDATLRVDNVRDVSALAKSIRTGQQWQQYGWFSNPQAGIASGFVGTVLHAGGLTDSTPISYIQRTATAVRVGEPVPNPVDDVLESFSNATGRIGKAITAERSSEVVTCGSCRKQVPRTGSAGRCSCGGYLYK
ncbi:hypothetical protein HY990_02695 [Candidatus Micrarchaeota archaeon]|nr:hypothetical protein [Candidatus Micrarchaeota archaeon]